MLPWHKPSTRRTPADLMQELATCGYTVAQARRPVLSIVAMPLLILAPLGIAAGVVLTVLELVGVLDSGLIFALVFLAAQVALLLAALKVRQLSFSGGVTWTVDSRGITVQDVGPVPWWDLFPAVRRMEPAPYTRGNRLSWVMPLSPIGVQRALSLPPGARQVLHAAVRDTLITGPQTLEAILIPSMTEMSEGEFASFLTAAHRHFTQRG